MGAQTKEILSLQVKCKNNVTIGHLYVLIRAPQIQAGYLCIYDI